MQSLGINTYGNLIRVGGQSKIEEIQQYNIRNLRKDYLGKRKFGKNYSDLRFRTRDHLLLHQDYRADLISLFRDLSNPEGIVNFSRLNEQIKKDVCTIDFRLDSLIPDQIASIFFNKNGTTIFNWLQMSYKEFESNRFSSQNIIRKWFRITSVVRRQVQAVNENIETPEEVEFEDEELRNIVTAHRMEEEAMEEDRKYKAERLEYHFCYKQEEKFRLQEQGLWEDFENAKKTNQFKDVKRLEGEIYELGLQINKFLNQCKFMKEFCQSYQDGKIELPTVTPDLLARANERDSLWRLSISEKWGIYFHFIDEVKKYLINEVIKVEAVIIEAQKKMVEVNNQGDGFILQEAKVVGMTTTGAAKYNTVLRMMRSKIGLFFFCLAKSL